MANLKDLAVPARNTRADMMKQIKDMDLDVKPVKKDADEDEAAKKSRDLKESRDYVEKFKKTLPRK